MNKILVSPSILSADFNNLEREILRISDSSADMIHIDVMDGHFVPNLTIGPPVIKSLRPLTKIIFDVHLMIDNAEDAYIDYIKAGADIITFHIEAVKEPMRLIEKIKSHNVKVGISLKPGTNFEILKEFVNYVDLILIMTVEPGFGGQSFMHEQTKKIESISHLVKSSSREILISVDGGINNETAKIAINYGANTIVSGSYLFKANDFDKAILDLKNLV